MQIINLLNKNGAMKTLDLANYFHVSRETMRRDLLALTEQGLIDKWFGGVICADQLTQHPVIYEDMKTWLQSGHKTSNKKEIPVPPSEKKPETDTASPKMQIARKALSLLTHGSTIFLDSLPLSSPAHRTAFRVYDYHRLHPCNQCLYGKPEPGHYLWRCTGTSGTGFCRNLCR